MNSGRAGVFLIAGLMALALTVPTAGAAATSAPTSAPCKPSHHLICVDRADSGRRVHARVGQTLQVVLQSAGLTWTGLREVGPQLLRPRGAAVHFAGSVSASYAVVKKGRTELSASGAPKCSPGKACPQFILLWRVQVVVG